MKNFLNIYETLPITHILLLCTVATICTIVASVYNHMLYVLSAYVITLFYCVYKNKTTCVKTLTSIICVSLFVIFRMNYQQKNYTSDQKFLNKSICVKGTVKDLNNSCLLKNQTVITLAASHMWAKHQYVKKQKTISIFVPTSHIKNIQINDIIIIKNIKLNQPKRQSDYECYLIKEGIWAVGHSTINTLYIIKNRQHSILQNISASIDLHIPQKSKILFDALFLGKKEKNIRLLNIQHNSTYWGIAHHMARSGIHLAILFGLIMFLLHYLQIAYLYRYLLCIFLLTGYALISQFSISFFRALCMILLNIAARLCKEIPSGLHAVTLTTLIVLLYNPMQLFFLDFQLSFGITYIIIWLFNIKKSKTIAFYKQLLIRF